jgi:hypothetical protein
MRQFLSGLHRFLLPNWGDGKASLPNTSACDITLVTNNVVKSKPCFIAAYLVVHERIVL